MSFRFDLIVSFKIHSGVCFSVFMNLYIFSILLVSIHPIVVRDTIRNHSSLLVSVKTRLVFYNVVQTGEHPRGLLGRICGLQCLGRSVKSFDV